MGHSGLQELRVQQLSALRRDHGWEGHDSINVAAKIKK